VPDGLYDSTNIVARVSIDTVCFTSNEIMPGLRASLTYVEANDGLISVPAAGSATGKSAYVFGASYTSGPLSASAAYKTKPQGASIGRQALDQTSTITGNQYRVRLGHSF
jgi:hypothetical protein